MLRASGALTGHDLAAERWLVLGAGASADAIDNIPTAVVGAAGPSVEEGDARCPICLEVRYACCSSGKAEFLGLACAGEGEWCVVLAEQCILVGVVGVAESWKWLGDLTGY